MEDLFTSNNNILYKNGIEFLLLPTNIYTVLFKDRLLTILVENISSLENKNILCYNLSKELMWQIAKPIEFHSENHFTGIYFRESKLYAYNINGVEYNVEPTTGQIIESILIK